MTLNQIIHGKLEDNIKDLPDNCIDAMPTDPPYGLKFMGKKWDHSVPSVESWKEVYRVLKPGGHMLVACGTRTQHRMVVNIEDAGFEIRDIITWHYGEGFPKSMDISKQIDKEAGAERVVLGINHAAAARNPRPRKISGQNRNFGEDKRCGEDFSITKAATNAAKAWDGWGTAIKPATEFWTLARKPISEKTVAANVLRWGVGALNIDACRIPFQNDSDFKSATFGTGTNIIGGNYAGGNHKLDSDRKNIEANRRGRFPANIILDQFMAAEMDVQSGERKAGGSVSGNEASLPAKNVYGEYGRRSFQAHGDSGGASRFFKVIKWTEEDRFWERFFYVPKPSPEERKAYNNHPTVKPLALMHYLIKMICPIEPGRVILDPFAGSGTTLIAARQLGLDFVAYEMEAAHIPIIEQRLKDFLGLFI